MSAFAYSFCIALLHSIWQAALLAAGFFLFTAVHKKLSSQAHKNLLLLTLGTQVLLFSISFVNALFGNSNNDNFFLTFTEYLPQQSSAALLYQLIFIGYTSIVVIKIIKTVYNWHEFKKQLAHTNIKPTIDIRLFTSAKAFHLGIKRKVQIWYSHKISSPITFGFLKPIILLPFSLVNQITLQQTEAIILHELAHIKANDYISNWFITFVETLFFFNPFVVLLCKKIKLQRELHCDNIVLQYNYSPIVYIDALLAAAKYQNMQLDFSLAAVSSKKQLLHRIKYFTDTTQIQKNKNPFSFLLAFVLALLLFLTTATLNIKNHQPSAKEMIGLPILGIETKWLSNLTNNIETKPVFTTKPILVKKINYTKPSAVKKSKIIEPKIEQLPVEYYFTPTSNKSEATNSQQIIIEEEQSGNKPAIMLIYKATKINSEWVLEPQMIITKSIQDSAKRYKDSTLPHLNIEQ